MKQQIENILIKVDEGTIPVQQALSELLDLFTVSSAVCIAPEHIKPCRHLFGTICQYNGHCNFKQTDC